MGLWVNILFGRSYLESLWGVICHKYIKEISANTMKVIIDQVLCHL